MRRLRVPIVLAFVDHHSQYLGDCAVNMLHTTVAAWMVGAGGNFSNTKKLIYDVGKLGAELEAVVREDDTWTLPKGDIPVDKDVGRAFSFKFSGGDGEQTAIAVGEKKNIGVTPSVAVSSALGTSSNGATTSGCIFSFLYTNRNARACEVCVPCLDGRKQLNRRLA